MKKDEFLKQLAYLLSDISEEERQEAIEFYRCYFEDAGEGSEERLIAELGSPEKVAYMIRSGLDQNEKEGVYTEAGYKDGSWTQENPLTKRADILHTQDTDRTCDKDPEEDRREGRHDVIQVLAFPAKLILIIVGVVILCAVMVALVAVAVGFAALTVGLFIAGFCALAFGIFGIIGGIGGLLAAWAGGFLILALAVLILIVAVLYCGKFLPWALRCLAKGIRNLCGGRDRKRRD